MTNMKRTPLFILIFAAVIGLAATTHDFFLVPEAFFLHKGDKLDLHLLTGEGFAREGEIKYQPAKTERFMLYEGSKKTDLTKIAKDGAVPLISYPLNYSGQALVEMTRGQEFGDASRDAYSEFLTGEGYDKLAEKVKSSNQFRIKEKYTRCLKTLVSVENHDGSAYDKVLNEDYEIVLKNNPYKRQFGDDMTALIKFKGKPAKDASVM
ncbi:MAG: DUF4198 domain-containing protein, partial [Bacteroidota bacterium]|nr:DUF4198 domain-containing protein [Bacteroidota bacterium]